MMRVLVTGSQTWTDRATVYRALAELLTEFVLTGGHDGLVIVHGDCRRGADRYARDWVEGWQPPGPPVEQEAHPADWSTGRGAGLARNAVMVGLGADLCVTFIAECGCPRRHHPHGTHGSVHCATLAREAGIPVRHVRPTVAR